MGAAIYLIISIIWMFSTPSIKPTFTDSALYIFERQFFYLGELSMIPGALSIFAIFTGYILGAIMGLIYGKIKSI